MPMPIAVLVSGSGSNLQSFIDRMEAGSLDVDIRLVLSNKAEAYGLERARKHGIPARAVDHRDFPLREDFDAELVRAIREAGAETVLLAGFMRILTTGFLKAFPGRVLNIHPALLPSFPGVHGQADAADYGVKVSGCTVHFVDEKMDHGPVIIQAVVPVFPDDDGGTLGKRILTMEHRIYPQAVQWLATGRLAIGGRKVRLAPGLAAFAEAGPGYLVNPPLEDGF